MISKKRFEELKNKKVFVAYYINIEDICLHKTVYIINDTLEDAKELIQQIEFPEYELLKKSINYLCEFEELDETEQELFEDKLIHFFEPEYCN